MTQRDESAKRIGDIVGTHVKTVERAFPHCAEEYDLAGEHSILEFLAGHLPRAGASDASLARQDDALTLADDEAARVATYIKTGTLPVAAIEPEESRGRSTPGRSRKRPRLFGAPLVEDEFVQLEEAEERESELIERPRKRARTAPREEDEEEAAPAPDFDFTQAFYGPVGGYVFVPAGLDDDF